MLASFLIGCFGGLLVVAIFAFIGAAPAPASMADILREYIMDMTDEELQEAAHVIWVEQVEREGGEVEE